MKSTGRQPKCARCADAAPAEPARQAAAHVAAHVPTLLDVLAAAQPAADEIAARLLVPEVPSWTDRLAAPRSARLACRQLRDVLDRCILKLQLVIETTKERRRWEAGRSPSLARWPGCSAVMIHIGEGAYPDASGGQNDAAATGMAVLLAMPFLQQGLPAAAPPAAAQPAAAQPAAAQPAAAQPAAALCLWPRITRLELLLSPWRIPANAFSAMLPLLPQLKELVLKYELAEAGDRALEQQQRMYDALSALPLLESLTLPGGSGLDRLAGLPCSGRLQVLEVLCGRSMNWRAAAMGISGLQQLQKLRLNASLPAGDEGFRMNRVLLRSLPRTLLSLALGVYRDRHRRQKLGVMTVALQDGRALRLGVEGTSGSWGTLLPFADLLRGWPALEGPQRQLLISLDCLALKRGIDDDDDPLWWLAEGPVVKLLQRCLRVELRELRVEAQVPQAAVLRAMDLLGKPGRLVLQCGPTEHATLNIRRASEEPELPAAAVPPPLPQQWRRRKAEQQCLRRLMGKVLRGTFALQRWEEDNEVQPPMYNAQQALQQFWDNRLMVGAGADPGDGDSSASSSSDGEDADGPDDPSDGAAAAAGGGAGGLGERARLAVMLRLWKKLVSM
ncbi:hypothetical protein TSOC_005854 [Tetrabaena socialis]|uniref:Uncharacterized protein n=1 Tax=Tetrabaena socialis TaxID=47790 RepID=A0A2J8A5B3_9CHLO|nr:hypothetical protein TSOC_005854 [Tetrabaena socialis]|eukprot:PNH07708.1 hypothetical protein TSOC_005854 [Tetrabaena socialis]